MKNIKFSEEIQSAILKNSPIVALESTIITHGMPFPSNYETAIKVENAIRNEGAVPATIVVLNGIIRVGLTEEEIKEISQNNNDFIKCTTADLAYALSKKLNGSTTVAATMYICKIAGLKIFVTGGIGGVHFGDDMDISADLIELSKTNVTVICAGAKSILDIPKTLEYLETFGVPVIGYQTNNFPEFFFSEGDSNVKITLDSPIDCANFMNCHYNDLGIPSGILIAVPVPKEDQADKNIIKAIISEAIISAKEKGIKGNKLTPFLLKEVHEKSLGETIKANTSLIVNNSIIGARISIEYYKLNKN